MLIMSENQEKSKILQLAADLDKHLESQNVERVLNFFSEDCQIELLGITLVGISGVKKWLNWFFSMFQTIRFEAINIIVRNDIFFEEFIINVSLKNGKRMKGKMAEVLVYKNYKIRSLRLYFDRLVFAEAAIDSYVARKLIKFIKKKSVEGLI
jgi:ketosteroid isomerase-like protein